MTVSSTVAKAVHITSSEAMDYSFPFNVFSARHLQVIVVDPVTRYETPLNLEEDYLLDDDDLTPEGGLIRLTEAGQLKAGDGRHLAITRRMDFLQEVDYRPHDIFPAETHERTLDILTMQDQELREMLGRAVIAPADQDQPMQYAELLGLGHEARAAADEAARSAGEAHYSAVQAEEAVDAAAQKAAEEAAVVLEALMAPAIERAETAAGNAISSADIAVSAAGEAAFKAGQIINLSARADTLQPGEAATANYDPATGELSLGVPKGEKGEAGKDGSGVNILGRCDSVSELPGAGDPGDAWLVIKDLYIWDAAGQAWTNAGPIRGPKGDKGDKGDQGEPGEKGDRGETGEAGRDGADAVVADATTEVKGIVQLAALTDETSADKAVTPAWVAENSGGGGFNTRRLIAASGTFTVPVTGWYKVTCVGGGGGGGKGGGSALGAGGRQGGVTTFNTISAQPGSGGAGGGTFSGGGGGGVGEVIEGYVSLNQGESINVIIGAGGLGGTGTVSGTAAASGEGVNAGVWNATSYSCNGGPGAAGASVGSQLYYASSTSLGSAPGGAGAVNQVGFGNGGGGGGGSYGSACGPGGAAGKGAAYGVNAVTSSVGGNGGNGGLGAVILDYFDSNA